MSGSEFSLIVPLAKLSPRPQDYRLEAGPEARIALAKRFDVLSIDKLVGDLIVERTKEGARLTGRLVADVVQACVVSGEPLPVHIDEPLALTFQRLPDDADDVELDEGELDIHAVENDSINLGEAIAQSLPLLLDPYPRADAKTLARARRLLLSEEDAEAQSLAEKAAANPFAILKPK